MEYARADCSGGHTSRQSAQVTVLCVAYSPEGDVVAAGCTDGCVRVWCARTMRLLHARMRRHGDEDLAPVQTVTWMVLPPHVAGNTRGGATKARVVAAGGAGAGAGAGAGTDAAHGCRLLVAGYHDGSVCAWHGLPTPASPTATPRVIMLGRHWGPVRRLVAPSVPGTTLITGASRRDAAPYLTALTRPALAPQAVPTAA